MVKRKSWERRERVRLSDQALLDGIQRNLDTLSVLADAYDNGTTSVATTMSTTIINIVGVNNRAASEIRGKMVFPTPEQKADPQNLAATHRLVGMQLGGTPPSANFLPWFALDTKTSGDKQSFRTWWETEPIYVASAAPLGTPLGLIPLRVEDRVAWNDREKLTRHQLCTDLRNTVGAHTDSEITAVLFDLYSPNSFGGAGQIQLEDGSILTTDDGSLIVGTSPVEAAMRQIAEEVLIAYGRRP